MTVGSGRSDYDRDRVHEFLRLTDKRIPEVTFRTRQDGQWKDVTTGEIFKGRTVVDVNR